MSLLRKASRDSIGWTKTLSQDFSHSLRAEILETVLFYIHWKLEKLNLTMKRKLTNLQKNNENERRANKENPESSSLDFSSATIPNNSPNYSTSFFQCFEELFSENSPTISSLTDNTEVKTTIGTSVLDKYRQKGYLADAESSQTCWEFSCVSEKALFRFPTLKLQETLQLIGFM